MQIVGVAACTMGVAHTYIASEKFEAAAKANGHEVRLETQGTIGIENRLTDSEIKVADIVLLAADIKISERERFEGKRVVQVPTDVVIKSPHNLVAKMEDVYAQDHS